MSTQQNSAAVPAVRIASPAAAARAAAQAPAPQAADTYDWDTAFGVYFKDANAAIVAGKSSPASFSGTYTDGMSGDQYTVAGSFGAWQLTGGSGSIVHMSLPISGGTITPQGGGNALQYDGTAIIEVSLNYLPQPASGSGTPNNLVLKTTSTDPQTDPVVTVQGFTFDPKSPWSRSSEAITSALGAWLNTNLQDFNHVFSVVVVNETADQGTFQWLKPTRLGYAVVAPQSAQPDQYVLGVMAMTENRTNPNLAYQISPNIIPAGCNAGFLISQERFVKKVFLPGVYTIFQNATAADFDTTNDGTTVTNKQALTFQSFTLEDGTKITDATVDGGKFTLTAFDQTLELQFTNMHFTWKTGYIVHLDYTGMAVLSADGNGHFQMKETGKPSLSVVVTKTTTEKWEELITGIIEGIVLAVVGAAIGGALGPAADGVGEAASDAASEGAESADSAGSDLSFSFDGVDPDEVDNLDDVESDDDSDASEDLANAEEPSYASKFKGWFGRNWSKLLGGVIGSALGVVVAKLPDILEAYAEKNLQDMPTLDQFAEEAVAPVSWSNTSGYTMVSLGMNRSLQMGLKLNYKS